MNFPSLINFPVFGTVQNGFLSFAESGGLIPFEVKRVYWIYEMQDETRRGGHAHKKGGQILIAFGGEVNVSLTSESGEIIEFVLKSPQTGLYIPARFWLTVNMPVNSSIVCLASELYDPNNYISDYNEFLNA